MLGTSTGAEDDEPSHASSAPRTLLEQKIRERCQTFDEVAEDIERYAHDHGEPGTLSTRHLKRLASGRAPDGKPIGRPRPATARLLERFLGSPIDQLLSPAPAEQSPFEADELSDRLQRARRVDAGVVKLLFQQLDGLRRLDRQFGTSFTRGDVAAKVDQAEELLTYSIATDARASLALFLCESATLAGWQALDQGDTTGAWRRYELARAAAKEASRPDFEAHATAEQAFVLLDLGQSADALRLLEAENSRVRRHCDRRLAAWLYAASGETAAANGEVSVSFAAFDRARTLLVEEDSEPAGPYVALNQAHLDRWYGHALARLGSTEAATVLMAALPKLDPSFVRAETALRVDLATALYQANDRDEADSQAQQAGHLARQVDSARQLRRLTHLRSSLSRKRQ